MSKGTSLSKVTTEAQTQLALAGIVSAPLAGTPVAGPGTAAPLLTIQGSVLPPSDVVPPLSNPRVSRIQRMLDHVKGALIRPLGAGTMVIFEVWELPQKEKSDAGHSSDPSGVQRPDK